MRKLLGIISVLTLFPTGALAQEPVCYMEWGGQTVDLSSLCTSHTPEQPNPLDASKFRFSELRIEPAKDGSFLVTGTITNESNKVSTLSSVQFNVMDPENGRILTSDTAMVEAGSGIGPGEQIAFNKIVSSSALGVNENIPKLQVKITGSS